MANSIEYSDQKNRKILIEDRKTGKKISLFQHLQNLGLISDKELVIRKANLKKYYDNLMKN